jgi:gliding motility-associated-like protein
VQRRLRINVASADTLCVGQSVSLRASGAERYEWFPSTWLDNPAIASPRSTPASTIRYSVIGHDSRNCFADTGFINLKVYPIPRISIKVGQRINLTSGASVKLETQNSGDVTRWNWFPNVALSCSTCPEPVASPKQNITYTVTATNDGACVARDQVTVTMICDNGNVFIPNTFSPNSNGTNDAFYPRGSGIMSVKSMKVFNRWGQIVFQRSNFDPNNAAQGWDGKFNSVDVQTDVYVYLIEIVCENQVIIPLKGNVTLLR